MRWRRIDREHDLEREIRSDLKLESEEQRENGLSPEEAHDAARRPFGNTTFVKEEIRFMWGLDALGNYLAGTPLWRKNSAQKPWFRCYCDFDAIAGHRCEHCRLLGYGFGRCETARLSPRGGRLVACIIGA
jgi:hypothetical protein